MAEEIPEVIQVPPPTNRKRRRRRMEEPAMPSLTSLMDIVTIILIYFIKGFAVSPISVEDPSVRLPLSKSIEVPMEAAVIMVTGMNRRDTNQSGGAHNSKQVPTIVIDDQPLVQLDPDTYRVPDGEKEKGYVITRLRQALLKIRKEQNDTAQIVETMEGFTGKVIVIADRETPYRVLADVLVTCGAAGFSEFKFLVVKEAG